MNLPEPITAEELALATRNRGTPLEALRYDITPTGLHYLLTHFDIPEMPSEHTLHIGGAVERPLALSLDDIRARTAVTMPVTLECAGNGRARFTPRPAGQPWLDEAVGTAEWTGTPLVGVLTDAGVLQDAVEIVFTGADHGIQGEVEHDYQRSLTIADALAVDALIAYEMNGRPLEPQHGCPLRLIVPGWYGMASVKWLTRIDAVTEPFVGVQQTGSYLFHRDDDDPGTPLTTIAVRALMIPPGFPDYPLRARTVPSGRTTLRGRAWSGAAPVTRVEVSVDDVWRDAELEASGGAHAWRGWSLPWDATRGEHALSCRATDATGATQPMEAAWNTGGYANNAVQRITVTVR